MTGDDFGFLICSERSGSNLIASLLNGHSAVSAPPPSHMFRLFATNAANYGDLARDDNWRVLVGDVQDAFAHQLGSWNTVPDPDALLAQERRVLAPVAALYRAEAAHDGAALAFVKENHTARFADVLMDQLPGCRFVYMVRDPRDVAASYLTTDGMPGGVARGTGVWLADQVENLALGDRLAETGRLHRLRYEDLLADTPGRLAGVAAHLGLEYEDRMLEFHRDARTRRNAARIAAWENLARPVQATNSGKYRKVLTEAEIEYVELRCLAPMRALGYAPDIVTAPPADAAARIAALEPLLRPGDYRLETEEEAAIRARRLAVIETVRNRRLP